MSGELFYLKPPTLVFNDLFYSFDTAEFAIIGVPFDGTTSFRPGSRFAPLEIRRISRELESYSVEDGVDYDSIRVCDLGDLEVSQTPEDTVSRLEKAIAEVVSRRKVPIVLGGEHTVSIGSVSALRGALGELAVLLFDAHADMRDEYPVGAKLSHATVARRIGEIVGYEKMAIVGLRALGAEEHEFLEEKDVKYVTSGDLRRGRGLSEILEHLKSQGDRVYLSVDLDVFDPSYAPGVSNPEPLGIDPFDFLEVVNGVAERGFEIAGFDVVEASPPYDLGGITSALAARIVKLLVCKAYKLSKRKGRQSS